MLNPLFVLFFIRIFLIRAEVINDPTLKPTKDFSASTDATNRGKESDPGELTRVIFHRTFDERKQIEKCYNEKLLNEDAFLGKKLQSTDEENLNKLYQLAFQSPEQISADTLHADVSSEFGGGPDEIGDIEEIVCCNDKQMKDRIDKYYQTNYKTTVAKHLATYQSGDKDYQDVIQKYCWVGLCQEKKITPEDAEKEAQALRSIPATKRKTDYINKLKELFDKHCEPDMKLIFQKYRQGGNGVDHAVSEAVTVDRQWRAYFQLVKYIEDVCAYYAFELRHAADDSMHIHINKINRIILTRSERDLFCIEKAYPSQDDYKTFTSRLSYKLWISANKQPMYVESIRYLWESLEDAR